MLLWLGAVGLVLAALGMASIDSARVLTTIAVVAFTSIWGMFLVVGGQWFIHWASDESPKFTHFFMLLWGIATLILVAIAR